MTVVLGIVDEAQIGSYMGTGYSMLRDGQLLNLARAGMWEG